MNTITSSNGASSRSQFLPSLNMHKDRWSVARTKNVESLYQCWIDNPSHVRILEDPKFKNDNLVMLKKELLDHLLEIKESYTEKTSKTNTFLKYIRIATQLIKANTSCDNSIKEALSELISIGEKEIRMNDKSSFI